MRRLPAAFLVIAVTITLSACDSPSTQLVGEWRPIDPTEMEVNFVFHADSTFTMNTGDFSGTGQFKVEAGNEVRLTPSDVLATVMPVGFTGTLSRDTINLCAPNGVCTDFIKIQ